MNLNQVTLPTTDLKKGIAFYTNLGLRLIVHTHNAYARFECPQGEATLSLHLVEEVPKSAGIWVYFEVAELDEWVVLLKRKGIVFEQDPKDEPWLWREAKLKDPDGNKLILYTAGVNRKNPPWRLKK